MDYIAAMYQMESVATRLEVLTAPVTLAILEMDSSVLVCNMFDNRSG